MNPNITIGFIKSYIIGSQFDIDYFWINLSSNKCLTITMIKTFINCKWCWRRITANKNITLDIIKDHPELPWKIVNILVNKNITMEFVKDNFNLIDRDVYY
jgi:hypothetical protein